MTLVSSDLSTFEVSLSSTSDTAVNVALNVAFLEVGPVQPFTVRCVPTSISTELTATTSSVPSLSVGASSRFVVHESQGTAYATFYTPFVPYDAFLSAELPGQLTATAMTIVSPADCLSTSATGWTFGDVTLGPSGPGVNDFRFQLNCTAACNPCVVEFSGVTNAVTKSDEGRVERAGFLRVTSGEYYYPLFTALYAQPQPSVPAFKMTPTLSNSVPIGRAQTEVITFDSSFGSTMLDNVTYVAISFPAAAIPSSLATGALVAVIVTLSPSGSANLTCPTTDALPATLATTELYCYSSSYTPLMITGLTLKATNLFVGPTPGLSASIDMRLLDHRFLPVGTVEGQIPLHRTQLTASCAAATTSLDLTVDAPKLAVPCTVDFYPFLLNINTTVFIAVVFPHDVAALINITMSSVSTLVSVSNVTTDDSFFLIEAQGTSAIVADAQISLFSACTSSCAVTFTLTYTFNAEYLRTLSTLPLAVGFKLLSSNDRAANKVIARSATLALPMHDVASYTGFDATSITFSDISLDSVSTMTPVVSSSVTLKVPSSLLYGQSFYVDFDLINANNVEVQLDCLSGHDDCVMVDYSTRFLVRDYNDTVLSTSSGTFGVLTLTAYQLDLAAMLDRFVSFRVSLLQSPDTAIPFAVSAQLPIYVDFVSTTDGNANIVDPHRIVPSPGLYYFNTALTNMDVVEFRFSSSFFVVDASSITTSSNECFPAVSPDTSVWDSVTRTLTLLPVANASSTCSQLTFDFSGITLDIGSDYEAAAATNIFASATITGIVRRTDSVTRASSVVETITWPYVAQFRDTTNATAVNSAMVSTSPSPFYPAQLNSFDIYLDITSDMKGFFLSKNEALRITFPARMTLLTAPTLTAPVNAAFTRAGLETTTTGASIFVAEYDNDIPMPSAAYNGVIINVPSVELAWDTTSAVTSDMITIEVVSRSNALRVLEFWRTDPLTYADPAPANATSTYAESRWSREITTIVPTYHAFYFTLQFASPRLVRSRTTSSPYITVQFPTNDTCNSTATGIGYLVSGKVTFNYGSNCSFNAMLSTPYEHDIFVGDTIRIEFGDVIGATSSTSASRQPIVVTLHLGGGAQDVALVTASLTTDTVAVVQEVSSAPSFTIQSLDGAASPTQSLMKLSFTMTFLDKTSLVSFNLQDASLALVSGSAPTSTLSGCAPDYTNNLYSCTVPASTASASFTLTLLPHYPPRLSTAMLQKNPLGQSVALMSPYALLVTVTVNGKSATSRGTFTTLPRRVEVNTVPYYRTTTDPDASMFILDLEMTSLTTVSSITPYSFTLIGPSPLFLNGFMGDILGTYALLSDMTSLNSSTPTEFPPGTAVFTGDGSYTSFVTQIKYPITMTNTLHSAARFSTPNGPNMFGRHLVIRMQKNDSEVYVANVTTPYAFSPAFTMVGPGPARFNPVALTKAESLTFSVVSLVSSLDGAALLVGNSTHLCMYQRKSLWALSSEHGMLSGSQCSTAFGELSFVVPSHDSRFVFIVNKAAPSEIKVVALRTLTLVSAASTNTAATADRITAISYLGLHSMNQDGDYLLACGTPACVLIQFDAHNGLLTTTIVGGIPSAMTSPAIFPRGVSVAYAGTRSSDYVRILTADGQLLQLSASTSTMSSIKPLFGTYVIADLTTLASLCSDIAGNTLMLGATSRGVIHVLGGDGVSKATWTVPVCNGPCPVRQIQVMSSQGSADHFAFVVDAYGSLHVLSVTTSGTTASIALLTSTPFASSSVCAGEVTRIALSSDNSQLYVGTTTTLCTYTIPAQPVTSTVSTKLTASPWGSSFLPAINPTLLPAGGTLSVTVSITTPAQLAAGDVIDVVLPLGATTASGALLTITPSVNRISSSVVNSTTFVSNTTTGRIACRYTVTSDPTIGANGFVLQMDGIVLSTIDMANADDRAARTALTVRFASASGAVFMGLFNTNLGTLVFADPFQKIAFSVIRNRHLMGRRSTHVVELVLHSSYIDAVSALSCTITMPTGSIIELPNYSDGGWYGTSKLAPPTFSGNVISFSSKSNVSNVLQPSDSLSWTFTFLSTPLAADTATQVTLACTVLMGDADHSTTSTAWLPVPYRPTSTGWSSITQANPTFAGSALITSAVFSADDRRAVAVTDDSNVLSYTKNTTTGVYQLDATLFINVGSLVHVAGSGDLNAIYVSASDGNVYRFPRNAATTTTTFYVSRDLKQHMLGNAASLFDASAPQTSGSMRAPFRILQVLTVATPKSPTNASSGFTYYADKDEVASVVAVTERGLLSLGVNGGAVTSSLFPIKLAPAGCATGFDRINTLGAPFIICAFSSGLVHNAYYDRTNMTPLPPSWSTFTVSDDKRAFGEAVFLAHYRLPPDDPPVVSTVDYVWVGTKAGYVLIYQLDVATGVATRSLASTAVVEGMTTMAASPDGRAIFVGTSGGGIYRIIGKGNVLSAMLASFDKTLLATDVGSNPIVRLRVTADGSKLLVVTTKSLYAISLYEYMGDTKVTFAPVEDLRQYSDGNSARATSMQIKFDWSQTTTSPLATLATTPVLVVDLTLDASLRTRHGNLVDFRREDSTANTQYSLLATPSNATLSSNPYFVTSPPVVTCVMPTTLRFVCTFSDFTTFLTQLQNASSYVTSATLTVTNVVTPNYIITDSYVSAAMTNDVNLSTISQFSSAVEYTGAGGLLHLVVAGGDPADALLTSIAASVTSPQKLQIVMNPPLVYRDGSFSTYSIRISNDANCTDSYYDESGYPKNGLGVTCCAFGSGSSYTKSLDREVPSESFASRLDLFAICALDKLGALITLSAVPTNQRTEQRRYSPISFRLRSRARFSMIINDALNAGSAVEVTMKAGTHYPVLLSFLAGYGPSNDPMTLNLVAPDTCLVCATTASSSCANKGVVTVSTTSTFSNIYIRCNVAGFTPLKFYLDYDPATDDVMYDTASISVYEVTGSLTFSALAMPIATGVDVPVTLSVDTPAITAIDISVATFNTKCFVHNGNNATAMPFNSTIAQGTTSTSFFFRCTEMLHQEDAFVLTATDKSDGMSPGKSTVIYTFGTSGIVAVQTDLATNLVTNVPVTGNETYSIIAADVQPFRVLMTPPPTRGSLFQVTVAQSVATGHCSISYSDNAATFVLASNGTTLNVVGYVNEYYSEAFYVICESPTAGSDSLKLSVTQIAGDQYRYSKNVSDTLCTLNLRSKGELRLYRITDESEENLNRADLASSTYYIPVLSETLLRLEFLPATGQIMPFNFAWNSPNGCVVKLPNTAATGTVAYNVPALVSQLSFTVACSEAITTGVAETSVSRLTITDPYNNYPSFTVELRVELALDLVLSDETEIPTGLSVNAPLHVHVTSLYTAKAYGIKIAITTTNGMCKLMISGIAGYTQSITTTVTSGQSTSLYIMCTAISTGGGTNILITSNDTTSYRIQPWEFVGLTSSGSIYISPSSAYTSYDATLPSIVQVSVPQELNVHLVPACVENTDFTFKKTAAAGTTQPLCGFTLINSASSTIYDTLTITINIGYNISSSPVYFRCDSVTRGGPSIIVSPSNSAYIEYYGSTLLPRGSYAFLGENSIALGDYLPFMVPYFIRIRLLPAADGTLGAVFTVSLSSFAAECTLAVAEAQAINGTSSILFNLTQSSNKEFLDFYIYCAKAATVGPALVVNPGTNVLYAVGASNQFAVTGLVRAVDLDSSNYPLINTPFQSEIAIDTYTAFTLYMMPAPAEDVTLNLTLSPTDDCVLVRKDLLTGGINSTLSTKTLLLVVSKGVTSPSIPVTTGAARNAIVIYCNALPGSKASPVLYSKQVSGPHSINYADYTAHIAFTIYGRMQVLRPNNDVVGSSIEAGVPTQMMVVLNPKPGTNTNIAVSLSSSSTIAGICYVGTTTAVGTALNLVLTFGAGSDGKSYFYVTCNRVIKPNTFQINLASTSGEKYFAFSSTAVTAVSAPVVYSYGTTTRPNIIESHTATYLTVSLPVAPGATTNMTVVLNNTANPLTDYCRYSTSSNFAAFATLPSSFQASFGATAKELHFYIYCTLPVHSGNLPFFTVTTTSGTKYDDYTSTGVIIRARRCSAYTGPDYSVVVVSKEAGGFYNPAVYDGIQEDQLFVLNNTLTYSCVEGYFLPTNITYLNTTLRCDGSTGSWVGTQYQCTPASCGDLTFDAVSLNVNTSVTYVKRSTSNKTIDTTKSYLAVATVRCVTGFAYNQVKNEAVRLTQTSTCQASGLWSPVPAQCNIIDCYDISALPDGGSTPKLLNSTTTYGSYAEFECLEGYAIYHKERLSTCTITGFWSSDSLPYCESLDCIDLTPPKNGSISYTNPISNGLYPNDTIAQYYCNKGYRLETPSINSRVCGTGGWEGSLPSCTPVVCAQSAEAENYIPHEHGVDVTIVSETGAEYLPHELNGPITYGMKLNFSCDLGYDALVELKCDDTDSVSDVGEFTGGPALCTLHVCPFLSVSDTHLAGINYEVTPPVYMTDASYQCNSGFRASPPSAAVKSCYQRFVEWQPTTEVSCVAVSCPTLLPILNGAATNPIVYSNGTYGKMKYLSTATYACQSDYYIAEAGTAVRTCTASGTWSGSAPVCIPYNCGEFPSQSNVVVAYTSNGFGPTSLKATASISCVEGYRLTSSSSSTCTGSGWNVTVATCVDIDECAYVNCAEVYGAGSYCMNTIGSYVCAPYIVSGTVSVSGYSKLVTVQYPLVGVVDETTKNINIIDTAGRDLLTFNVYVGYGLALQSGPSAGGTIKTIQYEQTISPYLSFSCGIQSIANTLYPQYQKVSCLTSAAAGLVLPVKMEFCSTNPWADDPTGDLCRWTPVRPTSNPEDRSTYPFVYRLNYPAPTTARATLRSVTYLDRTGRANLVGRSFKGETVAIYGTGFLNLTGAMQVTYGPSGQEDMYVCTVNTLISTPTIMACTTQDDIVGVDLLFRITVSGQSVISTDRFSYPLQLVLTEVSGCEKTSDTLTAMTTVNCPTAGQSLLTITGDGFLDPTAAYVNGVECPLVQRQNKVLQCTLPVGTGQDVSVIVSSGTQYIEGPAMLSYAAPSITSITSGSCSAVNDTYLYDCPRSSDTAAVLTLIGSNFGAEGAIVYVGGSPCANARHHSDVVTAHSLVTCELPSGTLMENRVSIVQMYGEMSVEDMYVSYMQCRPGYFSFGTVCDVCPSGMYSSDSGQTECKSCPAGSYNAVAGASSCVACPAGTYSSIGSQVCTPCPKGTYSGASAGLCTTCAVGTYSDRTRSTTCLPCSYGGSSDPDYAGCRCNPGFYMSPAGTCDACMEGGDCDSPFTTYFNVKTRPGYYPTALATNTDAPSVMRYELDLALDVDLSDDYSTQVFLSSWYTALFNETDIARNRIHIVSTTKALVAPVNATSATTNGTSSSGSGGTSGGSESMVAPGKVNIVAVPRSLTFSPLNDTTQSTAVSGVRVVLDVYPQIMRTDPSAAEVAQKLWALIGDKTSNMGQTFSSVISAVRAQDSYSRSAYVTFEACLTDACLGGDTLCSEAYTGPLCTVCTAGYGKRTTYKCESCGSLGTRIGWMLLSFFLAIIIIGVLAVLSIRDTTKNLHLPRAIRPSSIAAFAKIIVVTIQVWAIAAQYDLIWPNILSGLLDAADAAGSVGMRASSLDCFTSAGNTYGDKWSAAMRPLFLTSVAVFILPFLSVVVPLMFLIPLWYFHRRRYSTVLAGVKYTTTWSSQMETELRAQRDAMQRELDAKQAKPQAERFQGMDEDQMRNDKYIHARSAFAARKDLVASGTATADIDVPEEFRASFHNQSFDLNARGKRPLAPPVVPPSPADGDVAPDDDVSQQFFHVDDFADGPLPPSSSSQFDMPSRVRPSVSQRSMLRSRSRLNREQSFRDALTVGDRISNKGLRLRDVAMESSSSNLLAGTADEKGDGVSRTGKFSRANTITMMNGNRKTTENSTTLSGTSQRAPSLHKISQQVDDQSAEDYMKFQRDKRVYRLMIEKLADLRSYYICAYMCCIVVAMYLLHPNLTFAFFRIVGCKTVGGASETALTASLLSSSVALSDVVLPHSSMRFVLADMSMQCFSTEHIIWVCTLGLVIFALWVVGIPLVYFMFTHRNRVILRAQPNALPSNELRLRRNLEYTFAFIFLGYDSRSYYWFLVDMISKVLYVAIGIFFPGEMHVQFLLASFVAFAVISGQTAIRPFDSILLEQLQFAALLCTFISFFLANFFVVDTELSSYGVDIISYVVFIVIILFFVIAAITVVLMYRHDRRTREIREAVSTAIRRNLDPIPLLQEWQRNEIERKSAKRSAHAAGITTNLREINIRDVAADVQEELEQYLDNHSRSESLNGAELEEDAGATEEQKRQRLKRHHEMLDAEIGNVFARAEAGDDDDSAKEHSDEGDDDAATTNNKAKKRTRGHKAGKDAEDEYTGDFITKDLRDMTEERLERGRIDQSNAVVRSRKEVLQRELLAKVPEHELHGKTQAEMDQIAAKHFILPRQAHDKNQHERALHASGVQEVGGTADDDGEAERLFYTADDDDAFIASSTGMTPEELVAYNAQQEQLMLEEEAAAAALRDHVPVRGPLMVSADGSYAPLPEASPAAARLAPQRNSISMSSTPRASITAGAAPRSSTIVHKADGSTEVRVGNRTHVVRLVKKSKTGKVLAKKKSVTPATAPIAEVDEPFAQDEEEEGVRRVGDAETVSSGVSEPSTNSTIAAAAAVAAVTGAGDKMTPSPEVSTNSRSSHSHGSSNDPARTELSTTAPETETETSRATQSSAGANSGSTEDDGGSEDLSV